MTRKSEPRPGVPLWRRRDRSRRHTRPSAVALLRRRFQHLYLIRHNNNLVAAAHVPGVELVMVVAPDQPFFIEPYVDEVIRAIALRRDRSSAS